MGRQFYFIHYAIFRRYAEFQTSTDGSYEKIIQSHPTSGDMRLPTELCQDGWDLLPRPRHLRAHPGSHNMAEGHQGWSKRPTNWFETFRSLMHSVRTALSRGQVG